MNQISCPVCGQDETRFVNEGADLLLNRAGNFRLVQCLNCTLIYQNPQLTAEELAPHYEESYIPYQTEGDTQSRLQQLSQDHAITRLCNRVIARQPQAGQLLDIGCATGRFLKGMALRGWQTQGVELSAYAAEQARTDFGLEVFTGTLEQAQLLSAHFDVITMWDVLEHVPDPIATLTEVHRLLKPNGLFMASIPNPEAWEAKLFGSYWLGWERPRHLVLFNQKLLSQTLTRLGFKVEGVESVGGRLSLTLLSLQFYLTAKNIPQSRSEKWLKWLYNPLFRGITWPFYQLLERANKTTVMTVVARR